MENISLANETEVREDLINEDGAYVQIVRNWLGEESGNTLFNILRDEVPWERIPIFMYGKTTFLHRRMAEFDMDFPTDERWKKQVIYLRTLLEEQTLLHFPTCTLNEYKDGSEYTAYHSDKPTLAPYHGVASISLGGSRDFYFKDKRDTKRTIKTTLHHCDALLMFGRTQELFTHSIPKRAKGEHRISVTYR